MAVLMEADARFRVQEVIFLVDVKHLLVVQSCLAVIGELVVVAVGLVAHVAILDVGKHVPAVGDAIKRLDEGTSVEFVRI